MRTTKRFTPKLLERYSKLGRGTGTYSSYIPWHRVSRSDPASNGRSHLIKWRNRHYEFLSDKELVVFFFAIRLLTGKSDLTEQFPLSLTQSEHELCKYSLKYKGKTYPGTQELAESLRIKHPISSDSDGSVSWVMTTDLVLVLTDANGVDYSILAISVKDKRPRTKRTREKLELEESYWLKRGAKWLLITPDLYEPLVADTLIGTWPWALSCPVSEADITTTITIVHQYQGRALTTVLNALSGYFGSLDRAQCSFWQAVWSGRILLDLRRSWRPHTPITLINSSEFNQLNPVFSGRSAWS